MAMRKTTSRFTCRGCFFRKGGACDENDERENEGCTYEKAGKARVEFPVR